MEKQNAISRSLKITTKIHAYYFVTICFKAVDSTCKLSPGCRDSNQAQNQPFVAASSLYDAPSPYAYDNTHILLGQGDRRVLLPMPIKTTIRSPQSFDPYV